MKKIFLGVLFVLFGLTLRIGGYAIEWTPDFIGYILIWLGMKELPALEVAAQKYKGIVCAIIAYAAMSWGYGIILSMEDITSISMMSSILWGTIVLDEGIKIYVLYSVARGILELQKEKGMDLNAQRLSIYWKRLSLSIVGMWLGSIGGMLLAEQAAVIAFMGVILTLVCLALRFVMSILFAVQMYKIMRRYDV